MELIIFPNLFGFHVNIGVRKDIANDRDVKLLNLGRGISLEVELGFAKGDTLDVSPQSAGIDSLVEEIVPAFSKSVQSFPSVLSIPERTAMDATCLFGVQWLFDNHTVVHVILDECKFWV